MALFDFFKKENDFKQNSSMELPKQSEKQHESKKLNVRQTPNDTGAIFVNSSKKGQLSDEEVDLITGQVYKIGQKDADYSKIGKVRIKEKGEAWTSNFFKKNVPQDNIKVKYIKGLKIKVNLLVVCIEITYPIDKIEKLLKAVYLEQEELIKFVFFSNGIYTTEILFYNKVSENDNLNFSHEKILEFIKTKKEIEQEVEEEKKNSNVLLYDALEEAIQISKEKGFFSNIKLKEKFDEYEIENVKYIFIFSGVEKGSKLKKSELQNILKDLRYIESEFNIILTNPKNLVSVSTLGLRWIRMINI